MIGNPYALGAILLITEIVINSVAGSTIVSSILLGLGAGTLFTWKTRRVMTASDKRKVLSVYLLAVALISLLPAFAEGFSLFVLLVALFFVGLYGIFTYLTLSWGSSAMMKSIQKKQQVSS